MSSTPSSLQRDPVLEDLAKRQVIQPNIPSEDVLRAIPKVLNLDNVRRIDYEELPGDAVRSKLYTGPAPGLFDGGSSTHCWKNTKRILTSMSIVLWFILAIALCPIQGNSIGMCVNELSSGR